jgi:hypothetical protein
MADGHRYLAVGRSEGCRCPCRGLAVLDEEDELSDIVAAGEDGWM